MPIAPSTAQYCDPATVPAPGASDARKLSAVLEASGEANSYIRKRYELPLVQWGSDLEGHVRRMARYVALSDRGFNPANAGDQVVVKGYDDAVRWLKLVATGEVELVNVIDSTGSTTIDEAAPIHDGSAPEWRGRFGAVGRDDDQGCG